MSVKIDLEDSFEKYLKMSFPNVKKFPKDQYREMKRSFFAGVGSAMIIMADLFQKEQIESKTKAELFILKFTDILETITVLVRDFFIKEVDDDNKIINQFN